MKLLLKKTAKKYFLALDVGTEAVKALVFEKDGGNYSIFGSALEYFDELRPFENDKVIFKAKEQALIMAGVVPKDLLLGSSASILRSRVDIQAVCRKNPKEVIGDKEARNIKLCVFKETEKKIAEHFARESGILPIDIHFVDLEILEMKIDGYEIPRLLGYSGKNLELRILATFLPKDYFNNFVRIAGNMGFKPEKIINPIKSLPEVMGVPDGVFVDVGGEVTQICLVRNHKINLINDFRMGGKDFTGAILENFGMRYSDAKVLKENYSRGELSESFTNGIKEILYPAGREWLAALNSKLKTAKGLIPSDFFLSGGASLLPEIGELIGDGKVKLVYPRDFKEVSDKTGFVNSPQFINSILLFYAN